MKRFKPISDSAKPPVGRPKKCPWEGNTSSPTSSNSTHDDDDVEQSQITENQDNLTLGQSDSDDHEPPTVKKKRGHYRSYSIQFKMSVVEEMYKCQKPIAVVAEKYGVPRTTILSWKSQLRSSNCKSPQAKNIRGVHLKSGSGRFLSYPSKIDDEIAEWILIRRDAHLPVSRELVKIKARQLIKPHNTQFKASDGWLEKFMIRHGLSLRLRTSISQKLPAQLERKLESFLNEIRILRTQYNYPKNLIINMDETPMYFDNGARTYNFKERC